MMIRVFAFVLSCCMFMGAAGSSGSKQAEERATGAGAAEPAATAAAADQKSDAPLAFTEADLDGYERGIRKEIELVKTAQQRAMDAATPEERGEAAQAQWEDQTIPEGAKASGLPEERYRGTRRAVHEVFKTLDFQGKIDGPLSIDLSQVSPERRAELAKDPFDALAPSSAAALRSRMERLVPIWSEYMTLTSVAG